MPIKKQLLSEILVEIEFEVERGLHGSLKQCEFTRPSTHLKIWCCYAESKIENGIYSPNTYVKNEI